MRMPGTPSSKPQRHGRPVRAAMGLCVCLTLFSSLAPAFFKQREDRWAQQIQETLLVGAAVTLKDSKGHEFFSLYTAADQPQGAVILLHGLGLNPDWPDIISPLRRELPEHGWTTLSLQMPLQPIGAPWTGVTPTLDESARRIQAGLDYLHARGITHVVIIGHDLGAAMGAAFIIDQPAAAIDGLVGISIDSPTIDSAVNTLDPRLNTTLQMGRLHLPVLDMYGGLDLSRITTLAPLRKDAATQAGNADYQQIRDPDADHFFTNREKNYIGPVLRWLDGHWPAH